MGDRIPGQGRKTPQKKGRSLRAERNAKREAEPERAPGARPTRGERKQSSLNERDFPIEQGGRY